MLINYSAKETPRYFGEYRSPEAIMLCKARDYKITKAVRTLNGKDWIVISMRFGLPPYTRIYTQGEVGEVLGVCKQRVYQLQNRAISRLRKQLI